jgi:type VI secretion system protein ImpG
VRDEFLAYYERELTFFRQMGAEFAKKYPKIAARLQLEADRVEDPHVERLVESFAFLAARVHLKIDTGIGRIGQNFRTAPLLFEAVRALPAGCASGSAVPARDRVRGGSVRV